MTPQGARFDPQGARFDPQGARFAPQGARIDPRGPDLTPRGPELTPVYYIKAVEIRKFRKFREIPGFPSVSGGKFGFWPPEMDPKVAKTGQTGPETGRNGRKVPRSL